MSVGVAVGVAVGSGVGVAVGVGVGVFVGVAVGAVVGVAVGSGVGVAVGVGVGVFVGVAVGAVVGVAVGSGVGVAVGVGVGVFVGVAVGAVVGVAVGSGVGAGSSLQALRTTTMARTATTASQRIRRGDTIISVVSFHLVLELPGARRAAHRKSEHPAKRTASITPATGLVTDLDISFLSCVRRSAWSAGKRHGSPRPLTGRSRCPPR